MNKEKIITGAMMTLLSALIGGDLRNHITRLAESLLTTELEGQAKKELVMDQLKLVGGDLGKAVAQTASFILSMAVDIVVAYLKARL